MRATSTSICETARRRARQRLAQLDLGRAKPPQLLTEMARARATGIDVRAKRGLEAGRSISGSGEDDVEPLGAREHACELMRARTPAAGAHRSVDACGFRGAGHSAELGCSRCSRIGFGDERAHLHAQSLGVTGLDRDRRAAEPHEIALCRRSTLGMRRRRAAQRGFCLAELAK